MIESLAGIPPRPAGNPSPRPAGGGPAFSLGLDSGAPLKPTGNPSPRQAEGGRAFDEYASFFVGQVIRAMRESTMKSGLVDGGRAEEAFQAFMDREYAGRLAGRLGFSKAYGRALERSARAGEGAVQESSRTA